jgi:hypothetical protein
MAMPRPVPSWHRLTRQSGGEGLDAYSALPASAQRFLSASWRAVAVCYIYGDIYTIQINPDVRGTGDPILRIAVAHDQRPPVPAVPMPALERQVTNQS